MYESCNATSLSSKKQQKINKESLIKLLKSVTMLMSNVSQCLFYLVNTRMRSKRDIKMGLLCTPAGAVLGIVSGVVTFRFLNGEAILDENMLFWVCLYALVFVLKILLDFRL